MKPGGTETIQRLFTCEVVDVHEIAPGVYSSELPDKGQLLAQLQDEVNGCCRCARHDRRSGSVFGEGSPDAAVMFVGGEPEGDDNATGGPFDGAAGELLARIVEAMGLRREEVYFCTVIKCRATDGSKPTAADTAACGAYLARQIAAVNPKVIVALGGTASEYLLGEPCLTMVRGVFRSYRGYDVMPTFHPSYLLRAPDKKAEVWDDMKAVMKRLGRPVPDRNKAKP